MIRAFSPADMDAVLDIWLKASVQAHWFVPEEFWKSKTKQMRNQYLPGSQTYVYVEHEIIKGFFSLHDNMLAAVFVSPLFQGHGIGKQLIAKVKSLRKSITLTVYRDNANSVAFYKKCGFTVIKEQVDEHTGCIELVMTFES